MVEFLSYFPSSKCVTSCKCKKYTPMYSTGPFNMSLLGCAVCGRLRASSIGKMRFIAKTGLDPFSGNKVMEVPNAE